MTKRTLAWGAAVGAFGALIASGAFAPDGRRTRLASMMAPDAGPIESLDRCIQIRLHGLEGFGFTRLADVPQHLHRFSPETPEEASAVAGLREDGRDVVLYLGGRGLLDAAQDSDVQPLGRRTFSRALAVTGPDAEARDLPPARALRSLGRKSLAASASGGPVTDTVGRWRIDVRPVRADREACLVCHAPRHPVPSSVAGPHHDRPLRIGDALGVVIYASSTPGR